MRALGRRALLDLVEDRITLHPLALLAALPALHGIGLQDGVRALGWIGDARALPLLEAREGDPDVSYDLLASDGTLRLNAATEACDAIRAKARKRTQ